MSINDLVNSKVLLISLALIIFVYYIMDDNYSKVILKN
jgi:hypothetical protein